MLKTALAMVALAVASMLVIPTVSQAAERESIRVSYADLNLAGAVGQNQLQRRIAFAAAQVCDLADPRDLVFSKVVATCRNGAVADAQPAVRAAVAAAQHPTVTVLDAAAALIVSPR